MNLDHGLNGVWPRPSQCGAASAVAVCVLSLIAAAAGGAVLASHFADRILDRLQGARP